MKTKFLVLVGLLLVLSVASFAQMTTTTILSNPFANDSTYTKTGPNTLATFSRIVGVFKATDTVSVRIIAQTKDKDGTTWTARDTTTVTVTSAAASIKEIVYRDNTTEKFPGMFIDCRWKFEFLSSGNGVAGTRNATFTLGYTK